MDYTSFMKLANKYIDLGVDFHVNLEMDVEEFACPECEEFINFEETENDGWDGKYCPYCHAKL